LLAALGAPTYGLTLPFTEDFNVDAAAWRDAAATTLTWVSSGGPDGGHSGGRWDSELARSV